MDERRSNDHRHHHHHHKHHHHHHRHHHRTADTAGDRRNEKLPPPSPLLMPPPSSHHPPQHVHHPHPFKGRNFKLLVDPVLAKGSTKLYRVEGFVSQDSSWNVNSVKDPRSSLTRIWTRLEVLDLPIPRLKVDSNYVGEPPGLEVTITNLNDNIDRQFLSDLVSKFGEIEDLNIFYHPVTHKHLGIARVVFFEVSNASACVLNLNARPVMGKKLVVFRDAFGKECKRMVEELTSENKPPPPAELEKTPHPTPSNGPQKHDSSSKDDLLVSYEKDVPKTPPKEDTKISNKKDIQMGIKKEVSTALPVPAAVPLVDEFSQAIIQKTPTHMPPPVVSSFAPFPPPPRMAFPGFHNRPPHMPPRPPHWTPPPTHFAAAPPLPQWNRPMPPQQAQPWVPPPRFLSRPQLGMPLPNHQVAPEPSGPLDLDTRIELLLKGGGMAPPFLAMDINSDEVEDSSKHTQDDKRPPPPRRGSDSSDEAYSPPPLPPGEDPPSPPKPPPPLSPATPLTSPFPESSAERYAPLSTPPSPFLSEEVYLESLIEWRLRHLNLVKQREKESSTRRKRLSHRESDKMSEISSEEDEADFRRPSKDDDRMSLSSLSSTGEKIEEVSVPSNPYGSYTFGNVAAVTSSAFPRGIPERDFGVFAPPLDHSHYMWSQCPPEYRYIDHDPRYPMPPPRPGPGHLPRMLPFHPPPLLPPPPQHMPSALPPVEEPDRINYIKERVVSRIIELLKTTLEKDILKRMTEVHAFNEFENWWETEEKKYNEELQDKDKGKDSKDDVREETKTTTESLLNSIIDSGFDSNYSSTGFGLGFRAALPKMPSFRRKVKEPSPKPSDEIAVDRKLEKPNESDEEEMVQQSDSESRSNEPEPVMLKRQRERRESLSSSDSSGSESPSSSSDSEAASSDAESVNDDLEIAKQDFLNAVDLGLLERMREKTPEARTTPVPSEVVSDEGSEDFSKPPKTPDIHLSDTEDLPRTPSPSGNRRLRNSAMEALITLGLDEYICDISIRKDVSKPARTTVRTPSPTIPSSKREKSKSEAKKNQKLKGKKRNVEEVPIDVDKKKEDSHVKIHTTEKTEKEKTSRSAKTGLKIIEEDSDSTTTESLIALEHSYSRPKDSLPPQPSPWTLDHDYSMDRWSKKVEVESSTTERKKSSEKLVSHLLDAYLKPATAVKVYRQRDSMEEMMKGYEFLTKGVDEEDIAFLKRTYDALLTDETQSYWLNDTHWVSHPVTDFHCNAWKHQTGSARTQGYYKMDPLDKQKNRHHYNKNKPSAPVQGTTHGIRSVTDNKGAAAASREARSNQRRLLTAFGTDTDSDLLKFNQLKFRKKQLKFSKSEIHDWGLFSMETIAADEMVIEYVGQRVRPFLADYREKDYEKCGIGSSYLFRIDLDNIIDATKFGNLARFINHSCNPNCYAKIITIEGQKKIVIYSKREIQVGEEITYDYKFPLEEEKIVCLCGGPHCKGFLN